ncbi:hypothetical protein [Streptomyces nigrescens]|uniref:hypothetical protein n=1 Tax=Streptomyces nigrescens TaxID=1920 RepID=UPI0022545177|nr:hypothetical protein [Streptomyces libani]MCX5450272.1 hypothetical protein [Streptomyces libani]
MSAIWWLVVVVALGVGWLAWRLAQFPGGWAYAFHEQYRADREALEGARGAVRQLNGTARREVQQAQTAVTRAEKAYRSRISRVEAELQQLRMPSRGDHVDQLGQLVLHEHALLIGDDEVPLAGLQVRFDLARSTHVSYVYLTPQPDGRERLERFAGDEFPEDSVRQFSVRIQNAAVTANQLQALRDVDIHKLEAELREAREATEPVETARELLEEMRARHGSDPQLPKARAALDDARDVWQELTGRRPL